MSDYEQETMAWNPEQTFENSDSKIHFQCRKNVKLVDDALKERLKSVSLVITTLLTSLHDTTTDDLNKGFKIATGRLDKITKSTERILAKVEEVLDTLADSPQVIALITMSMLVLVATVINSLIGIKILKEAKAYKADNLHNTKEILEKFIEKWTDAEKMIKGQPPVEENKKEILKEFVENWSKAENLIRGQPRQETMPISREVAVPNPLLQVTVRGQGHSRDNWQERDFYS